MSERMKMPGTRLAGMWVRPKPVTVWMVAVVVGAVVVPVAASEGLIGDWMLIVGLILFIVAAMAIKLPQLLDEVLVIEGQRARLLLRRDPPRVGEPLEGQFVLPRGSEPIGPLRLRLICKQGVQQRGEWHWRDHWWRHEDVQLVQNDMGILEAPFRIGTPSDLPATGSQGEPFSYQWKLEVAQIEGSLAFDFDVEMAPA